jgi:hypothetical protein
MAALINNEETTIFLGLNSSGESIILLHNLEVVPSSRLQKRPIIRPIIRALHGFGYPATIVTLNYSKTMQLFSSNCTSLTNIRKFVGYDKLTKSTPRTEKSQLKSRAIIALPPFISWKLMNLPDLSVDHVLSTVLKAIADYNRKKQQKITINLPNEDEGVRERRSIDGQREGPRGGETEPVQHPKTSEHTDDPILNSSNDKAYTTSHQPPAAANPKSTTPPKEAEIAGDTPIPKKAAKPSSFRNVNRSFASSGPPPTSNSSQMLVENSSKVSQCS